MLESGKFKLYLPEIFYSGDVDHPARHVVPILFGVQLLIPGGQNMMSKFDAFKHIKVMSAENERTSTTTRK